MPHDTDKPLDNTAQTRTLSDAELDPVAGGKTKMASALGSRVEDDKPLTPKQQEAEDVAMHFFFPITGIASFIKNKLD